MAIPTSDKSLVPYATNFHTRVDSSPSTFALTTVQADDLSDVLGPYVAVVAAMDAQREAGTRSKGQTEARNTARGNLLKVLRPLYSIVQTSPLVTNENRTLVGVAILPDTRHRRAAPDQRPQVTIASSVVRTVAVNVFDPTSKSKRAKAPNATSAMVYAYVGPQYPSDPSLWQLCGVAKQYTFTTTLPNTVAAGSTVWFCAAWIGTRGEIGPPSIPVSVNVQGGGTGEQQASLKLAA